MRDLHAVFPIFDLVVVFGADEIDGFQFFEAGDVDGAIDVLIAERLSDLIESGFARDLGIFFLPLREETGVFLRADFETLIVFQRDQAVEREIGGFEL